MFSSNSVSSSGNKKYSGRNEKSSGKKRCSLLRITEKMFFLAKWSMRGYRLNRLSGLRLMTSRSWSLSAIPYHKTFPSPGYELFSLNAFLPITYCTVSSSYLQLQVFTVIPLLRFNLSSVFCFKRNKRCCSLFFSSLRDSGEPGSVISFGTKNFRFYEASELVVLFEVAAITIYFAFLFI